MSGSALHALAERAGLQVVWQDASGVRRTVSPATLRAILGCLGLEASTDAACRDTMRRLDDEDRAAAPLLAATAGEALTLPALRGPAVIHLEDGRRLDVMPDRDAAGTVSLPATLPPGYHRLETASGVRTLAIAPRRAHTVADALAAAGREGKAWGLAVQLYGLRREGDCGNGDFAALADLAGPAGRLGADALAISPIHALHAAEPDHYSPYAPSSRFALNPAYAPLDCPPLAEAGLIDWRKALSRREALLRAAFAAGREDPAFRAFRDDAPAGIRHYALFEALVAERVARGDGRDWRGWPASWRDPASADLAAAAQRLDDEVSFHLYAQFRARQGLEMAQRSARGAGMAIGLIADLAVGADPAGCDAWARPGEMLRGVSVGAPPDAFNRAGQNWGLTTVSPRGLRRSGFAALRDMMASALRFTGGVRIDHAMGLARLWLVPDGASPAEGCYLHYPFADMRRIVALESVRHRGIIVAEDLGTVPPGFRAELAASGISGMAVMWFEREGRRFLPPADWRPNSVAMTTTHDLPTVAGWWRGTDLGWRERLGIAGESAADRAEDRRHLWSALRQSGCARGPRPQDREPEAVIDAAVAHIGTASSALALLPLEDALGLPDQPNLPGTTTEHPNWRRRMPQPASRMLDPPEVTARLSRLARARKNTPPPR